MKYTICFQVTGGVDIEANSADEAKDIFNEMDADEIEKIVCENEVSVTEVRKAEEGC